MLAHRAWRSKGSKFARAAVEIQDQTGFAAPTVRQTVKHVAQTARSGHAAHAYAAGYGRTLKNILIARRLKAGPGDVMDAAKAAAEPVSGAPGSHHLMAAMRAGWNVGALTPGSAAQHLPGPAPARLAAARDVRMVQAGGARAPHFQKVRRDLYQFFKTKGRR